MLVVVVWLLFLVYSFINLKGKNALSVTTFQQACIQLQHCFWCQYAALAVNNMLIQFLIKDDRKHLQSKKHTMPCNRRYGACCPVTVLMRLSKVLAKNEHYPFFMHQKLLLELRCSKIMLTKNSMDLMFKPESLFLIISYKKKTISRLFYNSLHPKM